MGNLPFLTVTFDGKSVSDLLPFDPEVDINSAYQMLELFKIATGSVDHSHEFDPYRLVENNLKRQYLECLTGRKEEDISKVSLLRVMVFFQQAKLEARNLTQAINDAWSGLPYGID